MLFKKYIAGLSLLLIQTAVFGNHILPFKCDFHSHSGLQCPVIDITNVSTVPASCNASDGKILGLKVTGTGSISYTWYNSNNSIVGTTADLANVPAGTYKVIVSDESKCLAAEQDGFIVPVKNQLIFNNAQVVIKSPSCNQTDGSITNISVTNAVSYQWLDGGNNKLANTPDINGIGTGNFTLIATNKDGCSSRNSYTVNGSGKFPVISKIDTVKTVCGDPNQVNVTFALTDKDPIYHYFCFDETNTIVQSGIIAYSPNVPTVVNLTFLADMTYQLIVTDPNNCKTVIGNFSLRPAIYKIDTSKVHVRNDACGQHTGAIVNLHMIGAHLPPDPKATKFRWTDGSGKVVSQLLELIQVGAGTYTLSAMDGGGCNDEVTFTVTDSTSNATPPVVSDIKMCLPGYATINIENADGKGGYKLYDSTQNLVKQSSFGQFLVNVKKTSTFYVTHTVGECESPESPLTISVELPDVEIPNTFTPNNDGINDYWNIKNLNLFPGADVSVFDRSGKLLFHSINYGKPFDGRYNGKQLPAGVYYYIIDVHKPICLGKIAGSLTLIR